MSGLKQKKLRKTFHYLTELREIDTVKKLFYGWLELQVYYSQFTNAQAGQETLRECESHFLKKFFDGIREYTTRRRQVKMKKLKADKKFFKRYATICFHNWAWYSLHQ